MKVPLVTVSELPIFKEPPLVIVRLPTLGPAPPNVTLPETVKTEPLLKARVPVPLLELVLTATLAHTAVETSTVTVTPLGIVTASVDVGTDKPPQVAVAFQLPETDAVRCPKELPTKNKHNSIKNPSLSFRGFRVEVLLYLEFEYFCFMLLLLLFPEF
jgi:hypothetical protein